MAQIHFTVGLPIGIHRGQPNMACFHIVPLLSPPSASFILPEVQRCPVVNVESLLLIPNCPCNASKIGKWLIGGSIPEKSKGGQLYNTCLVFNPEGHIVAKHRKVMLFLPISSLFTGKPAHPNATAEVLAPIHLPYIPYTTRGVPYVSLLVCSLCHVMSFLFIFYWGPFYSVDTLEIYLNLTMASTGSESQPIRRISSFENCSSPSL